MVADHSTLGTTPFTTRRNALVNNTSGERWRQTRTDAVDPGEVPYTHPGIPGRTF